MSKCFESCDQSERKFYIRFENNFCLFELNILYIHLQELIHLVG